MAKIKIIEKNAGNKIPYRVSGTKIFFGEDDDLMLNLAKRQREYPVYMDVCADGDGNLVIGTGAGRDYVAQITIPAFQYAEPDEIHDGAAKSDEPDNPDAEQREPLPLDMSNIILTLWSVDEIYIQ